MNKRKDATKANTIFLGCSKQIRHSHKANPSLTANKSVTRSKEIRHLSELNPSLLVTPTTNLARVTDLD